MPSKINTPEPEDGLEFIDVHAHIPFPRPRNDKLPSHDVQDRNDFKMERKFLACY